MADEGTTDPGGLDRTLAATLAPATPLAAAQTLVADDQPAGPPSSRDEVAIERGALVGRYVVLNRLGAGGMGIVYAAYDPELDRKVALKLLRADTGRGPAASLGRTRLLREAQALAKLSHPHVVAVFDVGTLGDRVWLAMEYVDGLTFGTWLEQHPDRSLDHVLDIMTAVGRGLAAAHAAGLIHRDLKPDNIMVGHDGRVRVMDFGLARADGRLELAAPSDALMNASLERAALTAPVTQIGAVMGTPAYMAPEQWRGDQVDARVDQFAFCVTLWEALYGARPFDGDNFTALAAAVLGGHVRAPPRRARVPAWLRRLMLRGMQAAPERRFASLDVLLSVLTRGRARGRRVRIGLGLGLAAVLAAAVPLSQRWHDARTIAACDAAGAQIAAVWNERARSDLGAALQATNISYAATSFEHAVPWIDRWTLEWSQLRARVCREAEVEGTRSPELHARAVACLEERREELAALLAALDQDPAKAVVRAVSAAANLSPLDPCADRATLERRPDPPADIDVLFQVVRLRRELQQAQGLFAVGRFAQALERVDDILRRAEVLDHAPLILEATVLSGIIADKAFKYDRAEAALTRAYVEAGAVGADDLAARAAIDLVIVHGYGLQQFDAAMEWSHSAELFLRRLGKQDDLLGANYLNTLAIVHKMHGDFDLAQAELERSLAIREGLLGDEHPDVALGLNNLANLEQARGNLESGLAIYPRVLELLEKSFGPDHPHYAAVLGNYASTLYYSGRFDEAKVIYERALAIREKIHPADSIEVLDVLANLAVVLTAKGRLEEARPLHERVLAGQEQNLGLEHPKVADTLGNLALLHTRMRNLDLAETLELRALAIRQKVLGPDHHDLAHSLLSLGWIHYNRHDYDRAVDLLRRGTELREKALEPGSLDLAPFYFAMGANYLGMGRLDDADRELRRALDLRERLLPDDPSLGATLHAAGLLRRLQGDLDAAESFERRALAQYDRIGQRDDVDYAGAHTGLCEIAILRDRHAEAVAECERSLEILPTAPQFAQFIAEAQFALARALADAPAAGGRDLPRARNLAAEAAETYRALGDKFRRELMSVETWLKKHKP